MAAPKDAKECPDCGGQTWYWIQEYGPPYDYESITHEANRCASCGWEQII